MKLNSDTFNNGDKSYWYLKVYSKWLSLLSSYKKYLAFYISDKALFANFMFSDIRCRFLVSAAN